MTGHAQIPWVPFQTVLDPRDVEDRWHYSIDEETRALLSEDARAYLIASSIPWPIKSVAQHTRHQGERPPETYNVIRVDRSHRLDRCAAAHPGVVFFQRPVSSTAGLWFKILTGHGTGLLTFDSGPDNSVVRNMADMALNPNMTFMESHYNSAPGPPPERWIKAIRGVESIPMWCGATRSRLCALRDLFGIPFCARARRAGESYAPRENFMPVRLMDVALHRGGPNMRNMLANLTQTREALAALSLPDHPEIREALLHRYDAMRHYIDLLRVVRGTWTPLRLDRRDRGRLGSGDATLGVACENTAAAVTQLLACGFWLTRRATCELRAANINLEEISCT